MNVDVDVDTYLTNTLFTYLLDACQAKNNQDIENRSFKSVLSYRKEREILPKGYDNAGFNLLHWAVVCNQLDEVRRLIHQEKFDVNATSKQAPYCKHWKIWNATPLFLGAMQNHVYIVSLLCTQKADQTIRTKVPFTCDTKDPLLKNIQEDMSVDDKDPFEVASEYQFHEIVNLLVLKELDSCRDIVRNSPEDEITFCCVKVGFTNDEKLNAITELSSAIKHKTFVDGLKVITEKHPALNKGILGKIYTAYEAARDYEEHKNEMLIPVSKYHSETSCLLF